MGLDESFDNQSIAVSGPPEKSDMKFIHTRQNVLKYVSLSVLP
jgi:hypothetical protein